MKVAFALTAGAIVGLSGWAVSAPDPTNGQAMCPGRDEACVASDVIPAPVSWARPDELAAPPRWRRCAEVAEHEGTEDTRSVGLASWGGAPTSYAKIVEFGTADLAVVVADFRNVGVVGNVDVARVPAAEPNTAPAPGTERRGYDGSRCPRFNRDDCEWPWGDFDVEVSQEAEIPDSFASRGSRIRLAGSPSALRVIPRDPARAPEGTIVLEGLRDDLDTWERTLDAETLAGGRDATFEVVRLGEPEAWLSRFGLRPPPPGTSTTIPLATAQAVARRANGAASVTLDVPEDRAVVGLAGPSCGYVADYDVEIWQATCRTEPIYRTAWAGLLVSARIGGVSETGVEVILDARWRPGLPTFSAFSTSISSGPVSASAPIVIEIPRRNACESYFRGHVRIGDGEGVIVGLSDGGVLVVVPRGGVRDTPRVRTWTHVDLRGLPRLELARPPASETIDVEWIRLEGDPSGETRGTARFEGVGECGAFERPDDVHPASLAAPGYATIVPGPVLELRRIDVGVRPSSPLAAVSRSAQIVHVTGRVVERVTVSVPCVSRAVIPLRFHLAMGETASRDVNVDRGEGPETWRISATRTAALR